MRGNSSCTGRWGRTTLAVGVATGDRSSFPSANGRRNVSAAAGSTEDADGSDDATRHQCFRFSDIRDGGPGSDILATGMKIPKWNAGVRARGWGWPLRLQEALEAAPSSMEEDQKNVAGDQLADDGHERSGDQTTGVGGSCTAARRTFDAGRTQPPKSGGGSSPAAGRAAPEQRGAGKGAPGPRGKPQAWGWCPPRACRSSRSRLRSRSGAGQLLTWEGEGWPPVASSDPGSRVRAR